MLKSIGKQSGVSVDHISGHPSAAGRALESSPVRDRRSTTVLRHQYVLYTQQIK